MPYYLVTSEDTIIQVRDYLVKADSEDEAKVFVSKGVYITESKPETVDTLNSWIPTVEEITDVDNKDHDD